MHDSEFEIKLAQIATFDEFKAFLNGTFLCHEAQVALVRRGNNNLLREYASRFVMCEEAQVALAEMRNKEILLLYVKKYKLCQKATETLIKIL